MKGFVITLDAVIALSFIVFALVIIESQSYTPTTPGRIYLKQLSLDTVTVLIKTGGIDQALGGNISRMQGVIEATPKLACMNISVLDSVGQIAVNAVKGDCNETAGSDMQTTVSPEVYQGNIYTIRSESWFRKNPQ